MDKPLGVQGQHPQEKIFQPVYPIVEPPFVIRVFQCGVGCRVLYIEKILQPHVILNSSLKIVKFLQLRGRRQIAKPHKYYLLCVIVFFFWHVFSLFFLFLTGWEFQINSLQFAIFFSQQNNCLLHNKSNIYPDIGLMYFCRIHGLLVSIKPNPVGYLMLSNYFVEITPSDHAC